MISSEDNSIIFQGAIHPVWTKIACKSARKCFPKATIILSTWEGSSVDGIEFDSVIFSKDPGGFPYFAERKNSELNNVNRQILSTKRALSLVKTNYTLKTRTDFCITKNSLCEVFERANKLERRKDYCISKARIITLTASDLNKRAPRPFNISDFFFFGLTCDIFDLFDIPLEPIAEFTYFKGDTYSNRFFPEQYIITTYIKKHKNIVFNDKNDFSDKVKSESEQYIANNLYLTPLKKAGLFTLKPKLAVYINNSISQDFKTNLTEFDFLLLYKKYVDSDFKIPQKIKRDYNRVKILRSVIFKIFDLLFFYNKQLRRNARTAFISWLEKHILE